jgi:hypothetical protein
MVGDLYSLTVNCLGNKIGTVGVVFNEYPGPDNPASNGIQIIFPNGEYDGFSLKEQDAFLEKVGFDERVCFYKFKNVMRVINDYRKGYWSDVFIENNIKT